MSLSPSKPTDRIPRWLVLLGSLVVASHLLVVLFGVLAAPSGPWPTMDGPNQSTPPQFAFSISNLLRPYLEAIKMTHNYHFTSNRPGLPQANLEVRLKDADGQVIATVKLPDDQANFWVRQRQNVMVQGFADDRPVAPPQSEVIAPPQQQVPMVVIWEPVENRRQSLKTLPEHLVPRDRPVWRPSDWSLLLARSCARYLCRTHGAVSAEVIRHSRDPMSPVVLFLDNVQAGAFDELISDFGELPR